MKRLGLVILILGCAPFLTYSQLNLGGGGLQLPNGSVFNDATHGGIGTSIGGTEKIWVAADGLTIPSPPGKTGYFKILTSDDGYESGTIYMVGDYVEFGSSAENPPNPLLPHVRLKLGTDGSVGLGGDIAEGNFSQGTGGSYLALYASGNMVLGGQTVSPPRFEINGNSSTTWQGTNGVGLRITGATYTDTSSSGTKATAMAHSILTPILAASNTRTYTDAATLYIDSQPAAGTNVTITNPWALYIGGGNSFLNGHINATRYDSGGSVGVSGTCSAVTVVNGIVTGCTP